MIGAVQKGVSFTCKDGKDIYLDVMHSSALKGQYDGVLCFNFLGTILDVSGWEPMVFRAIWDMVGAEHSYKGNKLYESIKNKLSFYGDKDQMKTLLANVAVHNWGVAILTFETNLAGINYMLGEWFTTEIADRFTIVTYSSKGDCRDVSLDSCDRGGLLQYVKTLYGITDKNKTVMLDHSRYTLRSVEAESIALFVDREWDGLRVGEISDIVSGHQCVGVASKGVPKTSEDESLVLPATKLCNPDVESIECENELVGKET